jgi:hypothetical protein
LCLVALLAPQSAQTGTSYEAQIAGFMAAVLQTLITGEFAGRKPSQVDAELHRPVCRPSDYDDLRAAATDVAAFDAMRRRCKFTETRVDATDVYSTAYLPFGYCETLKTAFEAVLAEQVYAVRPNSGDLVIVEYKGSRYLGSGRGLARRARLQAVCQSDGALRVSAPRKLQ